MEYFEERARVAGWTGEEKKYRLKIHLNKTAYQTYCNLSKEIKESYSAVIDAIRKRFQPVDIEELRGAEFYQMTQTTGGRGNGDKAEDSSQESLSQFNRQRVG